MTTTVAELVNELHAEAHRGEAALLSRYVELVQQAAKGKLSPEAAAEAARLAYEMELPPDRFDRDLAVVKQRVALEAQIDADNAEAVRSREVAAAFKQKLEDLERERRQTLADHHRLVGLAHVRQERKVEHARLLASNPHLFADAGTLTDSQWKAVRQ